jgi:NAD-dependent dihydropyrimidine dehydrogenase PreA subunit
MLTAYPCVARRAHACYHQRHTILIPVTAVSGLESVAQQVACATTSLQQAWLSADTSLLGYGTEERQVAPGPGGTPTIQVDPMTPPSPPEARPRPVVRESDCVGCALCANVCPVDGCITMVTVPSGRQSITWDELTAQRPDIAQSWAAMQAYREEVGIEIH